MTYEIALEKIHSLLTFGSRPGLDRMRELLRRLGNPQDKLRYIHVAGTNGKGSVCAVLSSVLVAAGYKTGLFISPYITDFRERIQINNRMIDKETLARAVAATFPVLEQLREEGTVITEFEYVNALQFYIHAQARCDIVVLETGMGGLLDCTNVIKPPLGAVITAIGRDHTAVLGDTLEAIAEQKCGIIKNGSAAFTSRQCREAMAVIEKTAARMNVPLTKSEDIEAHIEEMTLEGSRFTIGDMEYHIRLAGRHQVENALTALAALFYFRNKKLLSISDEAILDGLEAAANPARLQLLGRNPIVLLDGAHNPNGVEALRKAVRAFLPDTPITCVTGMLADKDVNSATSLLKGLFRRVFTVPVDNPRALAAQSLAAIFAAQGDDAVACSSPQEGLDRALAAAKQENGAVLICGSLYLAGEILSKRAPGAFSPRERDARSNPRN